MNALMHDIWSTFLHGTRVRKTIVPHSILAYFIEFEIFKLEFQKKSYITKSISKSGKTLIIFAYLAILA